jgi:hypothetical protein
MQKLRYEIMEKQAYALVKALKAFRVYVLHSKVTAYVPSASVKDILVQPDIDGKRGRWIAKILEFDLEIKPTKLIKGQGLAKLLAESNCKALGLVSSMSKISEVIQQPIFSGCLIAGKCAWYQVTFLYFLQELKPPDGMGKSKARALKAQGGQVLPH